MPRNGIAKKTLIAVGTALLIAFLGFTIHKIYISDPECYAKKDDFSEFTKESREDRALTKSLSVQNREAIAKMEANFQWMKESQIELKQQNAGIQALQMKILEKLNRDDRH